MINEFLNYVKSSPTAFHACENAAKKLEENGFVLLNEADKWDIKPNGKYYVTRNGSCIIAFMIPSSIDSLTFNISAAHLDSPTFKLKPNFTLDGNYIKLNTEVYGGPILNTWMDRPLTIAGRVIVKDEKGVHTMNVNLEKPVCMIPNCSIHYYPELNKGVQLNPQVDLLPLLGTNKNDLYDFIANKYNLSKENIVSSDLYLALIDRGMLVGLNDEFIMAPQIDNLECSYGCLKAFIESSNSCSVNVCALFDNEEIGSRTRQGAASTVLDNILQRVMYSLGKTQEDYHRALASSFIISADNAHAYHPNYPNKYDQTNACHMNKGIVVKNAARGSYTTDGLTLAYFKSICNEAGALYQLNTNRSDIPGGSTLGCISLGHVSIHSVDIGLPQLAMHSAYETAGVKDLEELVKALKCFYLKTLRITKDGNLEF